MQIVAVYGSWHLGQLQVGLSRAVRLGQGSEVVISTIKPLPMQASKAAAAACLLCDTRERHAMLVVAAACLPMQASGNLQVTAAACPHASK